MTTYRATAEQVGRFWHIQIETPRIATQARWASQVAPMAKEAIALALDVPEDDVDVAVSWSLPEEVSKDLRRYAELREQAEEARVASMRAIRDAAVRLHASGLGSTEVGTVLGMSRQRAHQLVSAGSRSAGA